MQIIQSVIRHKHLPMEYTTVSMNSGEGYSGDRSNSFYDVSLSPPHHVFLRKIIFEFAYKLFLRHISESSNKGAAGNCIFYNASHRSKYNPGVIFIKVFIYIISIIFFGFLLEINLIL